MRMLRPVHTLQNWPVRSSSSIFDDFDRLVDSFMQPAHIEPTNYRAACDINETQDHFLVSFDVPGIQKEDLSIEISGDQLLVSGERRSELKNEYRNSVVHHERSYGRFQRSFRLPQSVNPEKIEANYKDGVLELILPKVEIAKGRKVEIQSGKSGFLSRFLGAKPDSEVKDAKAC